ncbi:MAG: hypothetical protein WD894_16795 [Pirellulales bacterium]
MSWAADGNDGVWNNNGEKAAPFQMLEGQWAGVAQAIETGFTVYSAAT